MAADGELVDGHQELFFVDYLRLCFAFGAFVGYEGRAVPPGEIRTLAGRLVEF